jgi:hypothetical protein
MFGCETLIAELTTPTYDFTVIRRHERPTCGCYDAISEDCQCMLAVHSHGPGGRRAVFYSPVTPCVDWKCR